MVTTPALFQLTDDVAGGLTGLLVYAELEALTGVCRAATVSAFQTIDDELPMSVILPPEVDAARQLLRGRNLLSRRRSLLICISSPVHTDLLLETGIREHVRRVRVERVETIMILRRNETIQELQVVGVKHSLESVMEHLVPYPLYFWVTHRIAPLDLPTHQHNDVSVRLAELCSFACTSRVLRLVGIETRNTGWRDSTVQTIHLFHTPITTTATTARLPVRAGATRSLVDEDVSRADVEHLYVRLSQSQGQDYRSMKLFSKLKRVTITSHGQWFPNRIAVKNAATLIHTLRSRPTTKLIECRGSCC